MELGGAIGEGRSEQDLPAPERCARELPDRSAHVGKGAGRNGIDRNRDDREVVGHERMSRIEISRRDYDRASLRADVVQRASDGAGHEREHEE